MVRRIGILALALSAATAAAGPREEIIDAYRRQAEAPPDAALGERLWQGDGFVRDGVTRRCTTCHGKDLTRPGKHARTGKRIDPMAPSVTPDRFTDPKKVRKWFRRNCKWTLGRECTPREKASVLLFLSRF